jgi:hypothetical protein
MSRIPAIKAVNLGAFPALCAGNRAFRSNSSQPAKRFAAGFPLQSLALANAQAFALALRRGRPPEYKNGFIRVV